ncbi:bacteriocin-protection protein, partial [Leptospira barantonii]
MIELNSELIQKMRLKEGNRLLVLDNEKEYKFSSINGVRFTNQSSEADGVLLFANSSSSLKSAFLKILKSIGTET